VHLKKHIQDILPPPLPEDDEGRPIKEECGK